MAKAKTPAVVDTSAGTKAYALAGQYQAALDPRLPAGTVANLAADLATLGADPLPTPPPGQTPPATPPPSLAEAMATAVTLITALHEAIRGAQPKADVRKAYGASSKTPTKEAKALLADGEKIVTQAQANPSQALSLGILPTDVAALVQALSDLTVAENLAKGKSGGAGGSTGKERHAAEVRMHEAVARISGVGVLAFATNAAVRAEFAALKPMKNV
jgi:hypothetical protein